MVKLTACLMSGLSAVHNRRDRLLPVEDARGRERRLVKALLVRHCRSKTYQQVLVFVLRTARDMPCASSRCDVERRTRSRSYSIAVGASSQLVPRELRSLRGESRVERA